MTTKDKKEPKQKCNSCNERKTVSQFPADKEGRPRLYCILCVEAYRAESNRPRWLR